MIATMALGLLYLMLVRGLCLLTLLAHSDAQNAEILTPRPEVAVLPPHEHPTNADRARPPRSACSRPPPRRTSPWAECTRSLSSQAVVVASPPARNCTGSAVPTAAVSGSNSGGRSRADAQAGGSAHRVNPPRQSPRRRTARWLLHEYQQDP